MISYPIASSRQIILVKDINLHVKKNRNHRTSIWLESFELILSYGMIRNCNPQFKCNNMIIMGHLIFKRLSHLFHNQDFLKEKLKNIKRGLGSFLLPIPVRFTISTRTFERYLSDKPCYNTHRLWFILQYFNKI